MPWLFDSTFPQPNYKTFLIPNGDESVHLKYLISDAFFTLFYIIMYKKRSSYDKTLRCFPGTQFLPEFKLAAWKATPLHLPLSSFACVLFCLLGGCGSVGQAGRLSFRRLVV